MIYIVLQLGILYSPLRNFIQPWTRCRQGNTNIEQRIRLPSIRIQHQFSHRGTGISDLNNLSGTASIYPVCTCHMATWRSSLVLAEAHQIDGCRRPIQSLRIVSESVA
jgi:hypothetical protein